MKDYTVYSVIVVINSIAAIALNTPLGLPAFSFTMILAPISGVAGYIFGKRINRLIGGYKKTITKLLLVICTISCVFLYQQSLEQLNPGLISNYILYTLFALTFGLFYSVMGIFSVSFAKPVSQNRKSSRLNGDTDG